MFEEYEYNLVSCLMNFPQRYLLVADKIKPDFFEVEICRDIYQTIAEQSEPDRNDLFYKLRHKYSFKEITDVDLYCELPTAYQFECAGYLMCKARQERQKKKIMEEAQQSGDYSHLADDLKKIDEESFYDKVEKDNVSLDFAQKLDRICQGMPDIHNHITGFTSLDGKIEGFKDGELIIIGGRPGSGKTTLGLNIACNMARKHQKVMFFSLEMGALELHERLVNQITEQTLYTGMPSAAAQKMIYVSRKIADELPLKICDKSAVSPGFIYSTCLREKERNGLDVVFIDHINIMKGLKSKYNNRYEEITDISGQLKRIAKDLNVPVVCLTQLNRNLEARVIKAPTLADLRDSGAIEQDADIVLFVHRQEYHLQFAKPDNEDSREFYEWQDKMDKVKGKGSIIIAKNRRGGLGQIDMRFYGQYSKFTEIAV